MARLKLITDGRIALDAERIGSPSSGQAVATVLVHLALPSSLSPLLHPAEHIATGYALKVGYDVTATPLTYLIINCSEDKHPDAFVVPQSFNPFSYR